MIRGVWAFKIPHSDFLSVRIEFWSYIIVRCGHFPKNCLTQGGKKKLIGGQDLAARGVSQFKVDMIFKKLFMNST